MVSLPVLLGAHERSDDDVPAGLDATVRAKQHPVTELVVQESPVHLGEALQCATCARKHIVGCQNNNNTTEDGDGEGMKTTPKTPACTSI